VYRSQVEIEKSKKKSVNLAELDASRRVSNGSRATSGG
jgi:hypothetical protein